jgi:hypothetical protein
VSTQTSPLLSLNNEVIEQATPKVTKSALKDEPVKPKPIESRPEPLGKISVSALQYHVNIVLPDTRDQAVYDAIFKSLREHLA